MLSTLNEDGTRNWIRPKLARGRFLRRRQIVGYALIALFVALPFVKIGGRPALLLDLINRELAVFGAVFRPSDGFLLMLLGITIVIAVFLVTALFGRVWCGWACPQTVYLEHVFRPIERWLEGTPSQQAKLVRFAWQRIVKWAIYGVLSVVLANVFLAYFVGVEQLRHWVLGSPADHPGGFAIVAGVSALMLFDFAWFREQTCIVACPYGRLQAVLLDRQSLIIGYDVQRGEPRTKLKKALKKLPVVGADAAPAGDCVDCSACVSVCPTGIDIRDGLQMECIGCAQCIDACDAVMDKIHKPRGLIGYTSQDALAGKPSRLLRARTLVYPLVLAITGGLFVYGIVAHESAAVMVERVEGPSFVELPDGRISAQAKLRVENESDAPRNYTISLIEAPDATLRTQPRWHVLARKSISIPLFVDVPRTSFHDGRREVYIRIVDDAGFHRIVTVNLLGPVTGGTR
ncbi:MAG TPA: cytochrome c oxidase accessory protein CcoG [Kofleriaceae bacterium]|nr:cytochrome c oxidase accessory protein CcoG [Kofleriaceae bacterium]